MKNKSSTLCAIPFVSMMVNTDTTIRYCCMVKGSANKIKKEDGSFYTIKDQFVKDAWNSQDMKDIRLSMINGEKVAGCSTCYLQEESGRISNREHANSEWKWRLGEENLSEIINNSKINFGHVNTDIVYLDLRLGNLCNLKCRMCNPWNSSQILKEHIELDQKDEEYSTLFKKTFGKFPIELTKELEWFESDVLWDQVISLIPNLKKVYMTGGEPTLIDHNFKFMQECIDQGRQDIVLFFNTNCTNINKKFLSLVEQFNEININASLDGTGIVNDYIRAPSKWEQISSNIEKLAQLPNVKLGVTPTVQVYNLFNLVSILEWVDELNQKYNKDIFVDFLINVHPYHLSVTILPEELRNQARIDLENYRDTRMPKSIHSMTLNSIEGIIGLLKKESPADYQEQLLNLKIHTKSLDVERSQDINLVDVRIARIIND
jgi:MoaA/NifB/PqqE/SkfB family radical SAM enzyme